MEERERVIMRLLDFARYSPDDVANQVVHLVLYTVMDHPSAEVRKHGAYVILSAIDQLETPQEQEVAFRVTVHFAMSLYGLEGNRLEEFFEVVGHLIAQEPEEVQLAFTAYVVDVVAQHPDEQLRRAVLGAILVGVYEDGRNSVNSNLVHQLMGIINGGSNSDESSYGGSNSDESAYGGSNSEESSYGGSNSDESSYGGSNMDEEAFERYMRQLMRQ